MNIKTKNYIWFIFGIFLLEGFISGSILAILGGLYENSTKFLIGTLVCVSCVVIGLIAILLWSKGGLKNG